MTLHFKSLRLRDTTVFKQDYSISNYKVERGEEAIETTKKTK